MKCDERADSELLEVIELAKKFLEQQRKLGLRNIPVSRSTLAALESFGGGAGEDTAAGLKELSDRKSVV